MTRLPRIERTFGFVRWLTIVACCLATFSMRCEATEMARWFPRNTRLLLAFDDFDGFKQKYLKTGIGRLWYSNPMSRFRAQAKEQDNSLTGQVLETYGVNFDLFLVSDAKRFVVGGIEVSEDDLSFTFMIEMPETPARLLVSTATQRLLSQGAVKSDQTLPLPADIYTLQDGQHIVYLVHDGFLMISGDISGARDVIGLWQGNDDSQTLADEEAFLQTVSKHNEDGCDFTWFANVVRLAVTQQERSEEQQADPRGPFPTRHGFSGMKGIGGHGRLMHDGFDFWSTYHAYAPQQEDALQALAFEPGSMDAPAFVPAATSNTSTIRWNIETMLNHVGELYDDVTDAPGAWEGTLQDWQDNLGFDLLGGLAPLLSSEITNTTIVSESSATERSLTGIALKDPKNEKLLGTMLYRFWRDDQRARRKRLRPFRNDLWILRLSSDQDATSFAEAGMMVAKGRLWIATHHSLISDMLFDRLGGPLKDDDDYQAASQRLDPWINNRTFARTFVRSDLDVLVTYRALRSGGAEALEDTESIYAQVLRTILLNDDGEDRSGLDYSLLPDFEKVAEYFGFGAAIGNLDPTGWSGVLVNYQQ